MTTNYNSSFPNGVASGDVTQNSAVLWTRSAISGDVTFEYSTDPNFNAIAGTLTTTVTDSTIPVKVELTDLTPGTQYYYRVTNSVGETLEGDFPTSAEAVVYAGLNFGVSGDWRGELAPYPAINNVAEQDLDFFVEHGDTIYADIGSPAVLNPDGSRKEQVETLDEYRAKHNEVYSERFGLNTWADLRAVTPILATIDDHEVTNDFAGGAPASSDERFPETEGLINDTQLFENGLQTFQEYNPLRDDFYPQSSDERTDGERQLYRYNTYGNDAAVMVLDTRSFRDEAIEPPADFTNPEEVARVLAETLTQDITLLGEVQLSDLKQDLLAADEAGMTWKFVMVPEPIQNIFPGINTDAFEGYGKERTEILKFITENDIDNVVFVAADVHTTFVNNVTYQEVPFGEQIPTNVFEITTGAVAFDAPTGEFLGNLFVGGNPELEAFYNSLPIAPDTDDEINDKDDFVKQAVNNQLLTPLGFDPLGLDNNLPQAEGLIDAELIQGDYFVGHTYGWTQFDINPETQQLTVTTYGIEAYSEDELLANTETILSREPQIVSQFVVNPELPEPLDILLVNDDGYQAEGINILYDQLTAAGYNVTLVAPKEQQSGTGTFINVDKIFQPTEVVNFEPNKWYVDASPTVTTWAGLDYILAENEPDLVISGINEGENVGSNVAISSGTVSAASAAIQRGIPAIAVSAGVGSDETELNQAYNIGAEFIVDLVEQLENSSPDLLPEGAGLNVNIPANFAEGVEGIQGVAFTQLDEVGTIDFSFGELPENFGGGVGFKVDFAEKITPDEITNPQSEGERFLSGFITVTPIDGDWTAGEFVRQNLSDRLENAPEDATATPLDILITNDDGFDAEGIQVLYENLTAAGHNVTLVAPKEQQSGTGTLINVDKIFQPAEIVNFAPNQWYVDGSPRVTTWAGLDYILDEKPDLVISGINEGENIGPGGAVSSGTVSAAVTGLLRDVPAIAMSAGIDFVDETKTSEAYEIGADYVVDLIAQLQATQGENTTILPEDIGLNINIPVRFPAGVEEIKGVKFTASDDISPFDISFGELPNGGVGLRFSPTELPSDVEIDPLSEGGQFLSGFITVTPLNGDWNAPETLSQDVRELISPLLSSVEPTDGDDVLIGSPENDIIAGLIGNDLIYGGDGDDILRGDLNNRSTGGTVGGNDTISGGLGNDQIGGKAGNDQLFGDEGDDFIWGDDGDDLMSGGLGNDTLTGDDFSGGEGTDTFVLAVGEGTDTIVDFEVGIDVIALANLTFTDLSLTSENGNTLITFGDETLAILEGVEVLSESAFSIV
jgi:5'/3'-nucleotidase SurE